jgi:hypothetical protein
MTTKVNTALTALQAQFEAKINHLQAIAPAGTSRATIISSLLAAIARHPDAVKPEHRAVVAWLKSQLTR